MSRDHSANFIMETNTNQILAEPVTAMVVGSGPWLASVFAAKAHDGQKRRDGQTAYIMHPQAVAYKLRHEGDEVVMTAWLHDVLEDTAETPDTMRAAGIPERVIDAVRVLTKADGVSYREYLERVKADEIARKVKVADMLHNLSDSPTERQIVKYARGLLTLLG